MKKERMMWGPELDDVFRLASWIIMCHNIWFAYKSKTIGLFKDENLSSLIISRNNYPINYDEYPLYFFFVLIDTIEAVKRFNSFEPLKSIYISIQNDIIIIENELQGENRCNYCHNLQDFGEWFTTVDYDKNKTKIHLYSKEQ